MKAKVEIELTRPAQKQHIETMRTAAESLTIDKESVTVTQSPTNPKLLIAEFRIKKSPQYKVVDRIGHEFRDIEDYNDSTISFSDDEPKRTKPKSSKSKTEISDEIKIKVSEIIEKFNKETFKNPEIFYVPRYKGKYLYLDRSEYGDRVPICRLEFNGRINNWGFALYKYSDERYDPNEFFSGMKYVNGTIVGAMKAGMKAYPD